MAFSVLQDRTILCSAVARRGFPLFHYLFRLVRLRELSRTYSRRHHSGIHKTTVDGVKVPPGPFLSYMLSN